MPRERESGVNVEALCARIESLEEHDSIMREQLYSLERERNTLLGIFEREYLYFVKMNKILMKEIHALRTSMNPHRKKVATYKEQVKK